MILSLAQSLTLSSEYIPTALLLKSLSLSLSVSLSLSLSQGVDLGNWLENLLKDLEPAVFQYVSTVHLPFIVSLSLSLSLSLSRWPEGSLQFLPSVLKQKCHTPSHDTIRSALVKKIEEEYQKLNS